MATTWSSVLGWRLGRHYLGEEQAPTVEAVVERLVALPAWSGDAATAIGLRMATRHDGAVAAAIAEGRIFSTYAFRGATHLMTPDTAAVHLALRCAGRQWELPSWRSHYRLEADDWPRLRATVRDVLRDGPLTQDELAAAVAREPVYRHLRAAFEDQSHTLLKPFGWQGDLCFSPSDGPPTFRSLDSIPGWTGLAELDDAGPQAIRAYLGAYGPATPDRLSYWLGEGLSAGRKNLSRWIAGMAEELVTITIEGDAALCLVEHIEAVTRAVESELVVLLPGSDQWVLGAGTSDHRIVPTEHRAVATRGANLVLVGGRVRGTWKTDRTSIQLRWLDGVSGFDPSSVTAAATRLSTVLGRDLHLADR